MSEVQETEAKPLPALFRHALSFYRLLETKSVEEEVGKGKVLVFRGSLTQTYAELGISQTYYTDIKKLLSEQGCVTELIKGGRSVQTVLVLHQIPNADIFLGTQELKSALDKSDDGKIDINVLRQQVDDLKRLIGGIDIAKALVNIESRLAKLEGLAKKTQKSK